jgi:hypothetical protein
MTWVEAFLEPQKGRKATTVTTRSKATTLATFT